MHLWNNGDRNDSSHSLPVQTPVLYRLGDVILPDAVASRQVGDGPGHFEDAGVGAGGEAEPVGGEFQHPVAGGVRLAELPDEAGGHVGVAVDFRPPEPFPLDLPRLFHPFPDRRGAFPLAPVGQFAVFHRRHLSQTMMVATMKNSYDYEQVVGYLTVTANSTMLTDKARAFSMAATKRLLLRLSRRHRPSP